MKAPLIVARQWMRHRVGVSYNEISGRYVELKNAEFYTPVKFREQSKNNRQASVDGSYSQQQASVLRYVFKDVYAYALVTYNHLIAEGVAKEQARLVLPQGMYTEFYFTCNLASLRHFIELRDHSGAQWEIQQYAKGLKQIAMGYWPIAIKTLEEIHGSYTK